jgi:hypothetical protein
LGIGKLLYLSRWSRPYILNITQALSRNFMKANKANLKAMKKVMTFCVNMKDHGIFVNPDGYGNGKAEKDYYLKSSEHRILIMPKIWSQEKV